ncbi:MAG: glycosyl transferase family 2 [Bacteroidetes bacterium]|nr:MAG: glycosyl transferase family 2 [Bacteroidota bacterium]
MSLKRTVIIQARKGSTRLPNKLLLPFFQEKNILETLIDRVFNKLPVEVIIATTNTPQDNAIENIAKRKGLNVFRGSENDVLDRFIAAAEEFGIQEIIRVCADNPFLDYECLNYLCTEDFSKLDYVSYKVNNIPSIKTHYGFWAEYTTTSTLLRVQQLTHKKEYYEHVTNYIYENPDIFRIKLVDQTEVVKSNQSIRLTIDTKKDYELASKIYSHIFGETSNFGIKDVIKYLNNNPHYYKLMQEQINANQK